MYQYQKRNKKPAVPIGQFYEFLEFSFFGKMSEVPLFSRVMRKVLNSLPGSLGLLVKTGDPGELARAVEAALTAAR
jgi:hypothetical protein